ncbi:MAG: helix-turn-helix transcriptional regulator [Proteobacteria bacterium]|nr:helix-turn-helix transcriptional regulator [Pseudomonadota bacterium]
MTKRRDKVAKAFGRVVREMRNALSMSQEDLAGEAGLDRTYPSLLETGKRTPTLTVIMSIARVFSVTAAWLVKRTEEELKRL